MSVRWSVNCLKWASCSRFAEHCLTKGLPIGGPFYFCILNHICAIIMSLMSEETYFKRHLLVAVFTAREQAERAIGRLIENDYPADSISLLGRGVANGDDILGVYHPTALDRMKAWGKQGAIWGGLWGLLGGTAAAFTVPGLGALLVIGPIVEGIAAAATGAGAMAVAALLSEVLVVLNRFGVPEEDLQQMEQAIKNDCFVMILQGDDVELEAQLRWLQWAGASSIQTFPGQD